MRRLPLALIALASLLLTSACSSSKDAAVKAKEQARFFLHTSGPVLYSPNAEPMTGGVLGRASCFQALDDWFKRVDTNRDGTIDRAKFMADARIQFLRMDLNGDGVIYPSELRDFRLSFKGTPKHNEHPEDSDAYAAEKAKMKDLGIKLKYSDEDSDKLQDFSDPVMSADRNLDFRVTMEEFLTQASDIFKSMDINHTGTLDKAKVFASCPPAWGNK